MKLLLITLTVLQSLLTALEQKTLQSDFTISIADSKTQPITHSGSITMQGKQFVLEMFAIEAAYDGHTLYMYSEDTEELTLSTPTDEELIETNPLLYAQALLPICQYAEKAIGDKTQLTLTPYDSAAGISKFILRVVTNDLIPASTEIHEVDGKVTTLRFTNPQYINQPPTFRIEKNGVFINDLR